MNDMAVRCLANITALERMPYHQAIPARTTYGLIENAARRFGERDAFRFLPCGDLHAQPQRVSYLELLGQIRRAAATFLTKVRPSATV